ncbi:MAG: metallophosphoesterase [Kiritimatiellae bacterium]|nr:metallophosphoesterase [Kiritimatiellia bacterium]
MPKQLRTLAVLAIMVALQSNAKFTPNNTVESNALAEVRSPLAESLIRIPPWVQLLDSDRLGVGWMTKSPADGVVEWTQDTARDTTVWRQAWFSEDGLRTANSTLQKAVIEGFDPAKPLRLRAKSRPINSFNPYAVTFGEPAVNAELTLPPRQREDGKVSFIVFNDIHSRTFLYPMLLPLIETPVDFAVFNGDVLHDPKTEADICDNLLLPMSWFASRSIPCFFLRGNHETRGAKARNLRDYLLLPNNKYYGALTFGAARVLLLDSGEDKPDEHAEYSGLVDFEAYMQAQAAWLERELSSAAFNEAAWRIAVMHIPPDWRADNLQGRYGQKRINALFAPLLDRGRVNVVISGHTHKPEVIEPCPDVRRGFRWPVFIGGAHPFKNATVIRVDANQQTLHVKTLGSDGQVMHELKWHR